MGSVRRKFSVQIVGYENDLESNLRELLEQKRKRKEAPTTELDSLLCCVRVKTPNGRIMYKL